MWQCWGLLRVILVVVLWGFGFDIAAALMSCVGVGTLSLLPCPILDEFTPLVQVCSKYGSD